MAMTVRLTPEIDERLSSYADSQGLSKQQALVQLIEQADLPGEREARLKAIFDKVVARDAVLMDRLADA
jgi:predicted transcriptional regulator